MSFRRSTGLRNKLLGISSNKISNPTFESGVSGWSGTNADLTSVAGGESGNSLQITNNTTSAGIAYQDFNVIPGRIYEVDTYIKAGTSNVTMKIGNSTTIDKYFTGNEITDNANWTHIHQFFIPDEETVRISFVLSSTSSGDNAYVDECNSFDKAASVKEIFNGGVLKIYTGVQPSSADDAPTGTLLVSISVNGTSQGISFDDAVNGVIKKNASEIWSGTAVATGTAGWFRLQANDDPESLSSVAERIDGAIATSGAELNMSNTTIESGAVQTISLFQISIDA
jgi:hypothetical protein